MTLAGVTVPLVGGVLRESVKETARLLETSEHAVRQRLYRGTLESERDERGSVVVLVPESLVVSNRASQGEGARDTQDTGPESALVAALREQNRILEEQLREANESNRENRRIIAGLTQRIPEIEPPREPSGDPETGAEVSASGTGSDAPSEGQETPSERRSWWRRYFGFE